MYTNRGLNLVEVRIKDDVFNNKLDINPSMIFRFDVRTINDIVTFRMGEKKNIHYLVAACADGYLRVLNLNNAEVIKAIKGVAGSPICLDIALNEGSGMNSGQGSEKRDLLAVGYDDDSFTVYSMIQGFKPLYRGLGHRSYVSQVRFDNYYIAE